MLASALSMVLGAYQTTKDQREVQDAETVAACLIAQPDTALKVFGNEVL